MTKKEILELARELYLTATPDGKHAYSLADIAEELSQRLNRKFHRERVWQLAKKHGWDREFAQKIAANTAQALPGELEQHQEALARGIRYVAALQLQVAERANRYLHSLGDKDRSIPKAVEAATKANLALMEILTNAGLPTEGEFVVIVEPADTDLPDQRPRGSAASQIPGSETAALPTEAV